MPSREVVEFQFLDNAAKDVASKMERERRRACDICRRKKRRCDGRQQCSQCVLGNFTCTYAQPTVPTKSRQPHDPHYADYLRHQLERAELALHKAHATPPWTVKMIKTLEMPFVSVSEDPLWDMNSRFSALSVQDSCFQGLVETARGEKPGQKLADFSAASHCLTSAECWQIRLLQGQHRTTPDPRRIYMFPDDDLLNTLTKLYFSHVNSFLPLLYRPRFELCVARRLHISDPSFGTTLLLVCALGSLYIPDGENREQQGRKWYDQVVLYSYAFRVPPTLDDLQAYCLAAHFLSCTTNLRIAWSITGFGQCLARDMGIDLLRSVEPSSAVGREESKKRALWILLIHDTQLGAWLGRSAVLDPVDIQVSLPSVLPAEDHLHLEFFNCLIKLYRLENFILRFLYPNNVDELQGSPVDARPIIAHVDAALDQWLESLPVHLVWDSLNADVLAFDQSATLCILYCYTRTLLHRAFVPAMHPPICNAAARECIRVADIHRRRRPRNPILYGQTPVFDAAMLLLLHAWDGGENAAKDINHVHTAIDVLKCNREHRPSCGLLVDVLERLLSQDESFVQHLN